MDKSAAVTMSFEYVVRELNIDGVGVTTVSVRMDESGFLYAPQFRAVGPPQSLPPDTWTTAHFGSAADGGFAETICYSEGKPAIGIYFYHGQFGYVSAPLELGVEPRAVKGVTQKQFLRNVYEQYGFRLSPGMELS